MWKEELRAHDRDRLRVRASWCTEPKDRVNAVPDPTTDSRAHEASKMSLRPYIPRTSRAILVHVMNPTIKLGVGALMATTARYDDDMPSTPAHPLKNRRTTTAEIPPGYTCTPRTNII